jgi:acyl-CoA synthetase (AMP-forming)/AMP-acid ligase II
MAGLPPRHPGNFADVLRLGAARFGDEEMLVFRGRRWSYRAFNARVNRIADGLARLGVGPDSVVASMAYNSDELLALYFAVAKRGAVSVPLNTMLRAADVESIVRRSHAQVLVYGSEQAEIAEALPADVSAIRLRLGADGPGTLAELEAQGSPVEAPTAPGDDRPSTVIYTSGSTGAPKGCTKSHANQIWSAINCQLETPRGPGDVELYVIPLAGVGFANFVLPTLLAGGRVVLDRFESATCLALIERERVTHAFLAGTMLAALLEQPAAAAADLTSLKLVETAYQLSDRLRAAIAQRFGPIVRYCYGSSEGSNWAAPAAHFSGLPDCVGLPKGMDDFRVVDPDGRDVGPWQVGEILIGGPTVMLGYFNDPEASADALQEGWLRTGDLGCTDDAGMLRFRGRVKDIIKSGGVNVPAGEVEMALARHPHVLEASVIGVPDDRWGEAVRAVVVVGGECSEDVLRAHCREHLAGHLRPKDYVFVEALPKNPGGKVAKGVLRELYGV